MICAVHAQEHQNFSVRKFDDRRLWPLPYVFTLNEMGNVGMPENGKCAALIAAADDTALYLHLLRHFPQLVEWPYCSFRGISTEIALWREFVPNLKKRRQYNWPAVHKLINSVNSAPADDTSL